MINALRKHWPEYLMEAWGLGMFMVSACLFAALLEYPGSPVRQMIESSIVRRAFMGLAMGLTAVGIIYSPWGQQSGAHINPAFTFTFYRLGKIASWDAFFYIVFQFLGAVLGVAVSAFFLSKYVTDPAVNYVVTIPGAAGTIIAFISEMLMSFGLMLMVLIVTNHKKLSAYTGYFAGIFLLFYITFEAPLSGMSINPARTFGSALPSGVWDAWWLYMIAPLIGMMLAAELYVRRVGLKNIFCAKLNHDNHKRCIFFCGCGNYRGR